MAGPGVRIVTTDGGPVVIAQGPFPGTPLLTVNPDGTITNSAGTALNFGASVTNPLGADLAAGNHKITGLAAGTASGDAARVGQIVANPLAGDLAAGTHKITGLGNGSSAQDAVAFGQLPTSAQLVPTSPADATKVIVGTSPPTWAAVPGGGGVANPMTSTLDAGTHELIGIGATSAGSPGPGTVIRANGSEVVIIGPYNPPINPAFSGAGGCYGFGGGVMGGTGSGLTTAASSCAVGEGVLGRITTGIYNTGMGDHSLSQGAAFINCCGYGPYTMEQLITGGEDTAVGMKALQNNHTGSQNTAVGSNALNTANNGVTPVEDLTAVGFKAGFAVTTGQKSVFVGSLADTSAVTADSQVAIGYGAITAAAGEICIGAKGDSKPCIVAATGAPTDASHADGSIYLRADGGALSTIYQARAGVWVGIV